jgi:hypothetical protein
MLGSQVSQHAIYGCRQKESPAAVAPMAIAWVVDLTVIQIVPELCGRVRGAEWADVFNLFWAIPKQVPQKTGLRSVVPGLAKVGVGGSNPLARSKFHNDLDHLGGGLEGRLSAECPRNQFPARSDQDPLLTRGTSEARKESREDGRPSNDLASPKAGVRQGSSRPATRRDYRVRSERPAHPCNRFLAQLNEMWRVVDDPLQWRLQRRKGNPRSKNAGWRDRSFCTTREGLLRCVREYCSSVEPSALAILTAVPEHHCMQNLDVRGTDQAQADDQSEPLPSKALEDCTAGNQSSRSGQPALT